MSRAELPGIARLYRPGSTVALSRSDRLRPGFPAAVAVARGYGFQPILRSAGGRAAAYDGDSLIYEEITPGQLTYGLQERFERVSGLVLGALVTEGFDAREGELPGEYCAGTHSINLAGRTKVAGIAQRAIQGAAMVSAVLVVAGEERLRSVLTSVYTALEYAWDPATVGSLQQERPQIAREQIESALRTRMNREAPRAELDADPRTLELAAALQPQHELD